MKQVIWESRRLLSHSWFALCSLALGAVVAGAIAGLLVMPAEHRLVAKEHEFSRHQESLRQQPQGVEREVTLTDVYARFPSQKDVPKWLSQIFTAARDMNVDLEIGQYAYEKERGTSLSRYQIELPVEAPYPTVRALIARLMNEMPFAALDDLVITKELPEDEVTQATLRFSIFVRGDSK